MQRVQFLAVNCVPINPLFEILDYIRYHHLRASCSSTVEMEMDTEDAASQPLTIVRIKRKRNEEPLEALVIESRVRRKKSRGIGVFKFAQTVETEAWEDEKQTKEIQDQISRLTREAATEPTTEPHPPPNTNSKHKDEGRHYTVLNYDDDGSERVPRPLAPPKVLSAKDMPLKSPDIKMFDAVLSTDTQATPIDPEMEKFLPMLNDYLKLHDMGPGQPPAKDAPFRGDATMLTDDYVWDVFYHRPATLSEWNEAANVGTLSGLPLSITNPYDSASESEEEEDEADEDSNGVCLYVTLARSGHEVLIAEEYYKNDYPDEESSSSSGGTSSSLFFPPLIDSSDEFHEHSDYDDMISYDADGNDYR
ncbi:hypothetical protein H0H93_006131 [Arthromyces matolae]|nr:hypothetical protein H0H93_006131 [Arthromyces matolae]